MLFQGFHWFLGLPMK